MPDSHPSRTLDLVTFTVPQGWRVEERRSGAGGDVVLSKLDLVSYCMMVVCSSHRGRRES